MGSAKIKNALRVSSPLKRAGYGLGNPDPFRPRFQPLRAARDIVYIPKCRRCGQDARTGIGLCEECLDDREWVRK